MSINVRINKEDVVYNGMKLEINHRKRNVKKNYYMETKLHATKKPLGQ